jgi:ubiquinone/menaquinone biosynthesis C-methylase UbiE
MADAYAGWRGTEVGRITDEIELTLILELVGELRGRRVLDIGCGDGALAVRLARGGAIVTGIDAAPPMIAAARRKAVDAGVEVEFCIGRAEALPFDAGSFDLVVAVTVLCFIPDATTTFSEASRVTALGGRFVIGELGRFSSWAIGRRIRGWLGNELWGQARFRTARELQHHARQVGLEPVALRGAVFYPRWRCFARTMRSVDAWLGRHTTAGAAFIALAARKC